MTSKERFLTVLAGGVPDRLPVTTHHVMPYFLHRYMEGMETQAFFEHFGLDPILWLEPMVPDTSRGERIEPANGRIVSDTWHISEEVLPGRDAFVRRVTITTPRGALSATVESNEHTVWLTEHFIKEKPDIDLLGEYMTRPRYDGEQINARAAVYGGRGLVRGGIMPCFEYLGQPGCWQDAACLVGIERLIMAAFEDPEWVHTLLGILLERKLAAIDSLEGVNYDLLELGGGDASTTVISPAIFDAFVAPYDSQLIAAAHEKGQRVTYHTCGGMMPILEAVADMGPDAMETFTPPGMGGDTDLAEAKRRIGGRVCMIGGFDQFHFFEDCAPEATRAEVRRCFEAAGEGGGYVLCPSDHFFDADPALVAAFAEAGRECVY